MKFEIYYNFDDGLWRWRLRSRNGRTVADGSEGYASEVNVRRAIKRVDLAIAHDGPLPIVDVTQAPLAHEFPVDPNNETMNTIEE